MTIQEVREWVEKVKSIAINEGDNEEAHGEEDDLWEAVLSAIAGGAENAAELANEALKTNEIKFNRWYA